MVMYIRVAQELIVIVGRCLQDIPATTIGQNTRKRFVIAGICRFNFLMAGVNIDVPAGDVPDSMIGRFIDRLDVVQYKTCGKLSKDIAALEQKMETRDKDAAAFERTIVDQATSIASLQTRTAELEDRLSNLQSQRSVTPASTPAPTGSHRGRGFLPPSHTAHLAESAPAGHVLPTAGLAEDAPAQHAMFDFEHLESQSTSVVLPAPTTTAGTYDIGSVTIPALATPASVITDV